MNWRYWAHDVPADDTDDSVCPMWKGIVPYSSFHPYDEDAALMVEEVLRVMHEGAYKDERWILIAYYGVGMTHEEIGERIHVARITVTTRRLPMAKRIFAEQWAAVIRKISPFNSNL